VLLEGGEPFAAWDVTVEGIQTEVEGVAYVETSVEPTGPLPDGYHLLSVDVDGERHTCMVVSSPGLAAQPGPGRTWGVFLPLYALRSERSLGVADFGDLGTLLRWVRDLGGHTVATLPLLAAFLDEPFDPSPYSPASRLFWNELYVDLAAVPELAGCDVARALLSSGPVRSELEELRDLRLVDYRRAMAAKRRVLEPLARCLFSAGGPRLAAFESFARTNPAAPDYARFRATCERHRTPWRRWPAWERRRGGGRPRGRGRRWR
jgi:4-alpha-glucanotransferase